MFDGSLNLAVLELVLLTISALLWGRWHASLHGIFLVFKTLMFTWVWGAPSGMFGTLEVLTWSSEKSDSDSYKGFPWKNSVSKYMTLPP